MNTNEEIQIHMNETQRNEKQKTIISLHRDQMGEIFMTDYHRLCFCIPLNTFARFLLFTITLFIGFSLLLLTLPLTGVYASQSWIIGVVYFISKTFIYLATGFVAMPTKQMFLICRPIRFSSIAFYSVGVLGTWITLFGLIRSKFLFIFCVLIQSFSWILYISSYLSFTSNILFDCIKRPSIRIVSHNEDSSNKETSSEFPDQNSSVQIELEDDQRE